MENFQTVIVGLMILFSFVALFVSNPPWLEALAGLLPNVPSEYPGWVQESYPDVASRPIPLEIIAYLGALGGGGYDYIGYVGTLRAKRWGMLGAPNHAELEAKLDRLDTDRAQIPLATDEENVGNGRAWLRAAKLDVLASFVSVSILAITFVMLGDVILGTGAAQQVPENDNILQAQAQFFSVISPVLVYLYQLAIWAAFFGSLQALSTIYPYTVREAFAPSFRGSRDESRFQKPRIWVNVYTFGGAILLLFTGVSYTTVISFAGVLGGVLSLGIWGFAQLWTEHKAPPAPFRMRRWLRIVVLISSIFLTAAGSLALVQFFVDLLG
ncbi:Nramp family divalent metal transporter [Brachybacterium sp. GPGPB12]|uniref:Nramp family divalent metal transporter n=1 Tax=Brachybacterium sp. GPGPB12 TaxID=3023517 RepID=UPI0031345EF0